VALDDVLAVFDAVTFLPRTLRLRFPPDITLKLSERARKFLELAIGNDAPTIPQLMTDQWRDNRVALEFFFKSDEDVRAEVLSLLTVPVHEYTHRIDFIISPFGLNFYVQTLREYWLLQEFFPRILDNPETVKHIRFLAGLRETLPSTSLESAGLKDIWEDLEGIIHIFYAWGDGGTIQPLRKYIEKGWPLLTVAGSTGERLEPPAILKIDGGEALEPVTILNIFESFRAPRRDEMWYLRPLAIFETRAIVNSLLFILHLFGEGGAAACLHYYENVYTRRQRHLPQDYFFLLDLGARLYDHRDFLALLRRGDGPVLRSMLKLLRAICWYALQAPPHLKTETFRIANPVFRLWAAYTFVHAVIHRKLNVAPMSAGDLLMLVEERYNGAFFQKSIKAIVPDCLRIIDNMIALNLERTWNPDVKEHFDHVLGLIKLHFANRELSYRSSIGLPNSGNPLLECQTENDWKIAIDDYRAAPATEEWFSIRTDLFFNLLIPADVVIKKLEAHYRAYLLPYWCECGKGNTMMWISRFPNSWDFTCRFCGHTKTIHRDDVSFH
jgi:hypothetical protein